jgi:hypothetical protein
MKDELPSHWDTSLLFSNVCKVLGYLVPVHDIPPVRNVLGPAVLVLEVVSVFPDVEAKNGEHDRVGDALHQGVVLVGRAHELQLIPGDADPNPSRTKEGAGRGTRLERGLHLVQRSEGFIDGSLECRAGLCLLGFVRWGHFIPEEGVVVVSPSVVADGGSRLESVELQGDDVHLIFTLSCLVNVCDICGVVFVVVDLHGGRIDVGFEGLEWIIQIGHSVGVGSRWRSDGSCDGCTLLQDFSARVGARLCPDRRRCTRDRREKSDSRHQRQHKIASVTFTDKTHVLSWSLKSQTPSPQ